MFEDFGPLLPADYEPVCSCDRKLAYRFIDKMVKISAPLQEIYSGCYVDPINLIFVIVKRQNWFLTTLKDVSLHY